MHSNSETTKMSKSDFQKLMLADKFRTQQDEIRGAAIDKLYEIGIKPNVCIETNAGVGNLTRLYKKHFNEVVTNDINLESIAQYKMDSMKFVKEIVIPFSQKIDHIDFDMYKCPVGEVKEFFKVAYKHAPFTMSISDSLGMWMKRSSKVEKVIEKYDITTDAEGKEIIINSLNDLVQDFDRRHPWRQHINLWNNLLSSLTNQYKLSFEPINVQQTKGMNYVLGSYLINHVK